MYEGFGLSESQINKKKHFGGVIVTVLTFNVVDHEFEPRSGQRD